MSSKRVIQFPHLERSLAVYVSDEDDLVLEFADEDGTPRKRAKIDGDDGEATVLVTEWSDAELTAMAVELLNEYASIWQVIQQEEG